MPYADTIRTANPTFENVATLIDGQIITYSSVEQDSNVSYTANGQVTAASIALSVAAGEAVLLLMNATCSHSVANETVRIRFQKNGTNLGATYGQIRSYRANTSGLDHQLFIHGIDAPSAGSQTYTVRIELDSATAYVRGYKFSAIKFRNS